MRSESLVLSCSFLFLSMANLCPVSLLAQDPTRVGIEGTVIDSRSGLPVSGVEVLLAELEVATVTDAAGTFLLPDMPLGTYQLTLRKGGYKTAEGPLAVLRPGNMVIRLDPTAALNPESSRIIGTVMDLASKEPLEGALVSIGGVRLNRVTDAEGRFELTDIPPGDRQLTVSFLGYSTRTDSITVPPASLLTLEVGMTVEPIELDPISVSVEGRSVDLELAGFYDRREATSGLFITRERIEERDPFQTTDLFRGLAGIKVVGGLGMGTQNAVLLHGSRITQLFRESTRGDRPCYPAIWIDGQMVHQGTLPIPGYLDKLVRPGEIAGVEVYNSPASLPVQYNLFGGCGVIVIWTRHGG